MSKYFRRIGAVCIAGLLAAVIVNGCRNTGQPAAGPKLFAPAGDTEKWTIRCCRVEEPGHVQQAEMLANMLKKVRQLNPRNVRVVSDVTGSTIYYGDYRRVPSPTTGQLTFPPEFQRDIEFVRSLSAGSSPPFFNARPELVDAGPTSAHPEWEATNASGTHSLLIAVFYNTPTFTERKQAAEQYVEILRKDGFAAYFYHEPVKSFVFVGDFTASDLVATPEGFRIGPRVEQMIARRADEFRNFRENGGLRFEAGDKRTAPLSQLWPLPRKDSLAPLPRQDSPPPRRR